MKKAISLLPLALTLVLFTTPALAAVVDEFDDPNALTTTDMSMATNLDLNSVQEAFNKSDPKANIKTEHFNPLITYKIRTRVFMGTMIVLPAGESIRAYDLGDSMNFILVPKDKKGMENIFTLQAKNYGSDTNLIVIGESGNIYSFYIRVDSTESPHVPDFIFNIQDDSLQSKIPKEPLPPSVPTITPEQKEENKADIELVAEVEEDGEYIRELPEVKPGQFDYRYKFVGKGDLESPLRVFDNGYWTWFTFSDSGNLDKVKVPTIYQVVDGYDTLVNVRIDGGSVVAETVSNKWTIRRGESYRCVRKQVDH